MQKTKLKIERGDIFMFEHLHGLEGSVQKGFRPNVVVSRVVGNTVSCAPITSSERRLTLPFVVEIHPDKDNKLLKESIVLVNQVFTCDISILEKRIGTLNKEYMDKIDLNLVKYFMGGDDGK